MDRLKSSTATTSSQSMFSLENLLKLKRKVMKPEHQLHEEHGSIQILLVARQKGTMSNISPFSFWSLSNLLPRCGSTFSSTSRCLLGTRITRSLQFQLYLRGYMNQPRCINHKSLKTTIKQPPMAHDEHIPFEFKL